MTDVPDSPPFALPLSFADGNDTTFYAIDINGDTVHRSKSRSRVEYFIRAVNNYGKLRELLDAMCADLPYVVGWNHGFDHALDETVKLQFPTMIRKMWSADEVQKWIDQRKTEAHAARTFFKEIDNG